VQCNDNNNDNSNDDSNDNSNDIIENVHRVFLSDIFVFLGGSVIISRVSCYYYYYHYY